MSFVFSGHKCIKLGINNRHGKKNKLMEQNKTLLNENYVMREVNTKTLKLQLNGNANLIYQNLRGT